MLLQKGRILFEAVCFGVQIHKEFLKDIFLQVLLVNQRNGIVRRGRTVLIGLRGSFFGG